MNLVFARNTRTGKVVKVPEHYLDHPVLGESFVAVDAKAKDYLPELYLPKTAEEFTESKKSRKKEPKVPEDVAAEVAPEVTE